MYTDLQQFITKLREEKEVIEINTQVDPNLEAAEIHRRVIAANGPALLFKNIKGSPFPLVTNLFGSLKRVELAFGKKPENLIKEIAMLPEELMPPTLSKLWHKKSLFSSLAKVGLKNKKSGLVTEYCKTPAELLKLPLLTTWEKDGGPFVTLPLVYTEHPTTKVHNLGMYRVQRYSDTETGLHMQIGKGGGFHMQAHHELNQPMPVSIQIGGPPALILSAIAPLPENVPELLLGSLVASQKLPMIQSKHADISFVGSSEFALVGEVAPNEMRAEGPFGDHYGYYSLKHDYPLFKCRALYHRKNPICAATVVGKPRQEDFYLGDYLQLLLKPLIKLVMPNVVDIWSYGETGYHSLASAIVKQRYKREAMSAAFRILGEGQLSLTKFLLLVDKEMDLSDFRSVLTYILERIDFRTDLYLFGNLSMDTLDYTGPKVNEGSKGVMLGVGEPIRSLEHEFHGDLPLGVQKAIPFCPGCLVIEAPSFESDPTFASVIARHRSSQKWPLLILVDDAERACKSDQSFLWHTFTRFEPAADIHAQSKEIQRNHLCYNAPIVIDARMKPNYPEELFCDQKTATLVSNRWKEYFPEGMEMGDSDLANL